MRESYRLPEYPDNTLTVFKCPTAHLLILGPSSANQEYVDWEFVNDLLTGIPRFDRDKFDPRLSGGQPDWTTLACTCFRAGAETSRVWTAILAYPRSISLTRAFIALEDEEGYINPVILAAFLQAERGHRLHRAGQVPLLAASFAALAAALAANILFAALRGDAAIPTPKNKLDKPLSDETIQQMIKSIPMKVFDGSMISSDPARSEPVNRALLPKSALLRYSDIVRWMVAFGRYLWSNAWWSSDRLPAFAHAPASNLSALISMIARSEGYLRTLPLEFRGVRFMPGTSSLESIRESPEIVGQVEDWFHTVDKLWPQLIELQTGEIPPEVLRTFLSRGCYRIYPLGVDMRFELEDDLIAMRDVAKALLTEAQEQAFYVPYGFFTLNLPEMLKERLSRIRLYRGVSGSEPQYYGNEIVRLQALDIFALPDKLWVRLSDGHMNGPIVAWTPGQPPMDNMLSESFTALLDAILSGIWRDLRVAGDAAVSPSQPRRAPAAQSESKSGRHRRRARSSSNTLILPRRPSSGRLYLSGHYDWSSSAEIERIRVGIRGIAGRPVRLPAGYRASEEALARGAAAGVVIPQGYTYRKPHTRGVYAEQAKTEDDGAIKIVSRGLATLAAFVGDPDTTP